MRRLSGIENCVPHAVSRPARARGSAGSPPVRRGHPPCLLAARLPIPGLLGVEFPAERIADEHNRAKQAMVDLPGSHLRDPEFSWKQVVPPAGLGFIDGDGLGAQYDGDLIVGSAVFRPAAAPPSVMANPGNLYRFRLNGGRTRFEFDDPRLKDTVADNTGRDDWMTEGEEILFGLNFGIVTDIQTGPDGALYLVGTSTGTIRKITKN
jgi:glucose/arabinose dehydrogenase